MSTSPPKSQFEFTPLFQKQIVTLLLRDDGFYQRNQELLKEDYFDLDGPQTEQIKHIVRNYLQLRQTYKKQPDRDLLENSLIEKLTNEEMRGDTLALLDQILSLPVDQAKGIEGVMGEFVRGRKIYTALTEDAVHQFHKGDYAGFLNTLKDSAKAVSGSNKLEGKSPLAFYQKPVDPEQILLGERYLCRGGSMLFIGPSGQGKSSAGMQMALLWSAGYAAFGIAPKRALKVMLIQAEDDDGDNTEMIDGIIRHAETKVKPLHDPEILARIDSNLTIISTKKHAGDAFLRSLRDTLDDADSNGHLPALVIINPLTAFLGGDPRDVELLIKFLREELGEIQEEMGVAFILICHTPKTNHRDTTNWKASDWMYAGAGAADLTNWARSIVTIDPATQDGKIYTFRAAKRGKRIGWGNHIQYFAHHPEAICWISATPEQIEQAEAEKKMKGEHQAPKPEEVIEAFQNGQQRYTKTQAEDVIQAKCKCSRAAARAILNNLEQSGKLKKAVLTNVGTGQRGGAKHLYELGI